MRSAESYFLSLVGKFDLLGFSKYDSKLIAEDLVKGKLNDKILLSNIKSLGWYTNYNSNEGKLYFKRVDAVLCVDVDNYSKRIKWETLSRLW